MKDIKSAISYIFFKIILAACGIFALLTLVTLGIFAINEVDTPAIPWRSDLLFFCFSLCYAACGAFFKLKGQLNKYVIVALHFISTAICVLVFFVLLGHRYEGTGSKAAFAIFVSYLTIYAVALPVWMLIDHKKTRKASEESEYTRKFKR